MTWMESNGVGILDAVCCVVVTLKDATQPQGFCSKSVSTGYFNRIQPGDHTHPVVKDPIHIRSGSQS